MRKTVFIAITILLASSLFVSCVLGSGVLTTETRQLNVAYTRISVSGSMDVVLESGRGNEIEVRAEDNIIRYIKTRVSAGKLNIGTVSGHNISPTRSITIKVPFNSGLVEADVSGSGSILSREWIIGRNFKVDVSGSGSVRLDLSGITGTVTADVSGSGNITLKLGSPDLLDADVSGSGSIRYSGTPASRG